MLSVQDVESQGELVSCEECDMVVRYDMLDNFSSLCEPVIWQVFFS